MHTLELLQIVTLSCVVTTRSLVLVIMDEVEVVSKFLIIVRKVFLKPRLGSLLSNPRVIKTDLLMSLSSMCFFNELRTNFRISYDFKLFC